MLLAAALSTLLVAAAFAAAAAASLALAAALAAAFAASNAARFFLALALSGGTFEGLGVLGGGGTLTGSEAFFFPLGRPLVLGIGNLSSGPESESVLSSAATSGGTKAEASTAAAPAVAALSGLGTASPTSALLVASITDE